MNDLNKLVNEYYELDRELKLLEKKKKTLASQLQDLMGQQNITQAFGDEVGYSLSFREKATYAPKVWELLGEKSELFRSEPKISKERITELLKEGDLNKTDLEFIEACKEVSEYTPIFRQIKKDALPIALKEDTANAFSNLPAFANEHCLSDPLTKETMFKGNMTEFLNDAAERIEAITS